MYGLTNYLHNSYKPKRFPQSCNNISPIAVAFLIGMMMCCKRAEEHNQSQTHFVKSQMILDSVASSLCHKIGKIVNNQHRMHMELMEPVQRPQRWSEGWRTSPMKTGWETWRRGGSRKNLLHISVLEHGWKTLLTVTENFMCDNPLNSCNSKWEGGLLWHRLNGYRK